MLTWLCSLLLTKRSRAAVSNGALPGSCTFGLHFTRHSSIPYNASFVSRPVVLTLSWQDSSASKELVVPRRCGFFILFGHRREESSGCKFISHSLSSHCNRLPGSYHRGGGLQGMCSEWILLCRCIQVPHDFSKSLGVRCR